MSTKEKNLFKKKLKEASPQAYTWYVTNGEKVEHIGADEYLVDDYAVYSFNALVRTFENLQDCEDEWLMNMGCAEDLY